MDLCRLVVLAMIVFVVQPLLGVPGLRTPFWTVSTYCASAYGLFCDTYVILCLNVAGVLGYDGLVPARSLVIIVVIIQPL